MMYGQKLGKFIMQADPGFGRGPTAVSMCGSMCPQKNYMTFQMV